MGWHKDSIQCKIVQTNSWRIGDKMENTKQAEDLLEGLNGFTGTENYYPSSFGRLKLTDGIQYLREKADCYWLIDIVESVQHLKKVEEQARFIIWSIVKNGNKAVVEGYWDIESDGGYSDEKLVYRQKVEYTDFPLDKYEFYQVGDVLLLKSEY